MEFGFNPARFDVCEQQFFRPNVLYERPDEGSDMLMMALLADDAQKRDPFLADELTSHLFAENPPHGLGTDLAALNIQRGRDHAIPGQCRPNHSLEVATPYAPPLSSRGYHALAWRSHGHSVAACL